MPATTDWYAPAIWRLPGLSVRIVERRSVVGGAAVTEEFYPGFRNSTASYTVSLLNPQVIRDLKLAQHGLRIVERPFSNFVPLPDGRYLKFGSDSSQTQAEVAKFSQKDAERLPLFYARLDRLADQLREWILQSPPNLGGPFVVEGWRDLIAAAKLLLQMGRLPREGQRDLIDVFTKSAGDWLDSWFESEPLKAVLGWDAIVGNYASPYAAGSAYVLLHHCFGEVNGKRGKWGHAIGGMGAITQAMAAEARARGVEIDVDAAGAASDRRQRASRRCRIDIGRGDSCAHGCGQRHAEAVVSATGAIHGSARGLCRSDRRAPSTAPERSASTSRCANCLIFLRCPAPPRNRITRAALRSHRRSPTWIAPGTTRLRMDTRVSRWSRC